MWPSYPGASQKNIERGKSKMKEFENPFVKAKKEAVKTTLRLIEDKAEEGILNDELVATLELYGYSEKTIRRYLKALHTLKYIRWENDKWFYVRG